MKRNFPIVFVLKIFPELGVADEWLLFGCWAAVLPLLVRTIAWNEGYPNVPEDFTITEKAPTRAFSW